MKPISSFLRTRALSAFVACLAVSLTLTGCVSQATIASLTNVLGTSVAQIAVLEGNPTLANKITVDKEAAVTAIANWKKGTNADYVIQALSILQDDLQLIPGTSQYAPLINIAIATAQSIILLLPPQAATPDAVVAQHAPRARRSVSLGYPAPMTEKDFKKAWENARVAHGLPATAAIK